MDRTVNRSGSRHVWQQQTQQKQPPGKTSLLAARLWAGGLLCCLAQILALPAQAWEMTPEQRQHLRHQMREQWQQMPPPPGMMPPPPPGPPSEGLQRASLRDGSEAHRPQHRHEHCQRPADNGERPCGRKRGDLTGAMQALPPPGFPPTTGTSNPSGPRRGPAGE